MPPEAIEIRRWLTKARNDWSVARKIMASDGVETDAAAFHCQQAVEKLLKAFLVSREIQFRRIHDLRLLLDHCLAGDYAFASIRDVVEPLTIYAATFRYPGPADPSMEDVTEALAVVERVWDFVTQRLDPNVIPE